MSLMDRFTALSQSAQSNGVDRLLLRKAFTGSRLEAFDNGTEVTDVVLWDEGSQSAILFLDRDWNPTGFIWVDSESPDSEWSSNNEELRAFFASCISYARENGIPLDEAGCQNWKGEDLEMHMMGSRTKNLLNELRTVIEGNYCSMDDIAYVEMRDRNGRKVCISPAIFMEMASQIEYQDGRGEATIHDDLKVVLQDGSFIGRMWSDGSEWFRFYERPEMNVNIVNLGRDDLCFLNSDMD